MVEIVAKTIYIYIYIYIYVYTYIYGVYRDNGKENGSYYLGFRALGLRALGVKGFRV